MNNKKLKLSKKAQEEMVGFAFIIIIVSVILLIFLSLTISKPKTEIESYKIESFVQSFLQYTSSCEDNLEYLSMQKVIFRCQSKGFCLDERSACEVLNETVKEIIGEIWKIENRPVEGYDFEILSEGEEMLKLTKGNRTNNYKGSFQGLPKDIDITFRVYYIRF